MAVTNSVIRKDADCKYFLFVPGIDRTDLPAPAAPDKGAVWFTDRRTRWLWDEDKGMAKKYLQAGRIRNAGVNTAADHKSLTRHRSYHWATEKYPLTSFTVVTQSGALADILDACVPQENPPPLRVRDPSLVDPPEVPILGVYMLFWDRQPCFFVKAVHPRGMVHGKDEPMGMLRLASPSSEYTERFNAALRPLAIISHLMCTLGLEPSAAADQVWAALLASPLWGQLGLDEGAAKAAIVELWPMIRHQLTLQFAITTEMPFLDDLSRLFEESRRVPALVAPPSCLGPRPTDEGSGTQPMEVEAVVADSSAGGGQQPVAAPSSPPAASHVLASATSQVEAGTTPSAASSVRGGSTEAPPSPSLPPSPPGAPRRDWGGSESPGEGPATPWETVGGGYGEEDRLDDGTGGEGGPASDSSPPGFEGMRRTRDLGAGEVVTGASGGNSAAVDKGAPPGGVSRPAKRKKGREGEARAGNKRPAPAVAERLSSGVEFISSLDEAGRHARLDHYKQEAKKVWTREVVLRRMRHLSSVYNIRLYGEGAVRRGEKVEAILKRTEGGEPLNEDDKRIVNTYLAPYLLKDRYTPFGRHFTLPNILGKIARHMLPFIRNGDTVVDFCCGANDFLHVLCQLCAATGLVDVTFIGYDIFPPGEKTAFFRRKDFLTVTWQEEGMPLSGDSLVMFSNPPFATAKSFLEHALGFDPRVLGIIIPEAEAMDKLGQNQLAKERGLYEEVETNTQLLMGNAFWIPGTSRYKGSVEPMADWNNTATWFRLFVKAHATGGDGVWSCNFDDVANADGIDAEEDRLAVPSGDSPLSGWQ
eukprot:jgi/Mesvir1/17813/Mv25366-RA.2